MGDKVRFTLLQKWEGTVQDIQLHDFLASMALVELKEPTYEHIHVDGAKTIFSKEEVDPADLPLLKRGAVFYLTVGYEDSPSGRRRIQMIRFRRLPEDLKDEDNG